MSGPREQVERRPQCLRRFASGGNRHSPNGSCRWRRARRARARAVQRLVRVVLPAPRGVRRVLAAIAIVVARFGVRAVSQLPNEQIRIGITSTRR